MHPGYKPKNHPHQQMKRGVDDSVDDRETPASIWLPCDAEFSFTVDAAAARHNAKCRRFWARAPWTPFEARQCGLWPESWTTHPDAEALDGLAQDWAEGERIWCNPPFSDLWPWLEKAHNARATVVLLLPANRTEQPWWQTFVEPYRDHAFRLPETIFLPGRRTFTHHGEAIGNSTSQAPPFGIVLVIYDRRSTSEQRKPLGALRQALLRAA